MKKKKLEKRVKKLEKRMVELESAYAICDCYEDCGCHDNVDSDDSDGETTKEEVKDENKE